MGLLPRMTVPGFVHAWALSAHSFSMCATLTLYLGLVCGLAHRKTSTDTELCRETMLKKSKRRRSFLKIQEEKKRYSRWLQLLFRCKMQAPLWIRISLLTFQFYALPLNRGLKGLEYCNILLVTMWPWTGELYFILKNSIIHTIVLQPDKVKFCLFSVMIGMVWASLPVQTHPEPTPQQLCSNWRTNIFSLWSATAATPPQGHAFSSPAQQQPALLCKQWDPQEMQWLLSPPHLLLCRNTLGEGKTKAGLRGRGSHLNNNEISWEQSY